MKTNTQGKPVYTRYFKAYLAEPKAEDGTQRAEVKVVFSKEPFTPEQFLPLVMGVMEAYAEQLLTNNEPEAVYENFNNAFGVFLRKLVPEDYVYAHSEAHKEFKSRADRILSQPEDRKDTEENRLAAYLLARDILTTEAHFSEESADYLLNKRLGLLDVPASEGGGDGEEEPAGTQES